MNLTALLSRLMSTWRTLPASPNSARGKCGSCSNVSSRPLFSVRSRNIHCTSCSNACKSNGSTACVARPASIFDISRMSLINVSRWLPLLWMMSIFCF